MNENRSGKQLLNRINQVSFAVDDLLLYLDTHPCDESWKWMEQPFPWEREGGCR